MTITAVNTDSSSASTSARRSIEMLETTKRPLVLSELSRLTTRTHTALHVVLTTDPKHFKGLQSHGISIDVSDGRSKQTNSHIILRVSTLLAVHTFFSFLPDERRPIVYTYDQPTQNSKLTKKIVVCLRSASSTATFSAPSCHNRLHSPQRSFINPVRVRFPYNLSIHCVSDVRFRIQGRVEGEGNAHPAVRFFANELELERCVRG
jgi:hypothetical protein